MLVIREPNQSILEYFQGKYCQKNSDKNRRIQYYCLTYYHVDGTLLYNMLTDEIILCNDNENIFDDWFYEHLFCIDEDIDETEIALDAKLIDYKFREKDFSINSYVILPTSQCNARCFYCYERRKNKITMHKNVAYDVAKYMMKTTPDVPIGISWFGGEPLYNQVAIDIICEELKNNGREFISEITTNGYLFNKKTIEKAKNLWNLKSAQITLDGLEKTYKQTKNYKNRSENPFKIVINNIRRLLKNDIEVKIRVNVGGFNLEESIDLVNFLQEEFKNENIKIYGHELFESECSEDDKYEILMLMNDFTDIGTLPPARNNYHCMADSKHTLVILPDGKIGLCQHFIDSHTIGSIYGEQFDEDMVKQFELPEIWKECYECQLLPICSHLKICEDVGTHCSKAKGAYLLNKKTLQLKNEYEMFKQNNPDLIKQLNNKKKIICLYNEEI